MQYFSRRLGLGAAALFLAGAALAWSGCAPGSHCFANKYKKQYPDRSVLFVEGCEKSPDVVEIVYNDGEARQLVRTEDFNRNGIIGDDPRDEYRRGWVVKAYPNDPTFELEGLYRAGFVSTPEGVIKKTDGRLGRMASAVSKAKLEEATRISGDERRALELALKP